MPTKTLSVRCRAYGALSNASARERIVLKDFVTEHVSFVLRLKGEASLKELKTLASWE